MIRKKTGNGQDIDHYAGVVDPVTVNRLRRLVGNATYSRSRTWSEALDPRRDIDDECGLPKTEEITVTLLRQLYDREALAARVVEVLPLESWQSAPEVYESEDEAVKTPFEQAWQGLGRSLAGVSWFEDEAGSPIWEVLSRADVLSGIGRYGVILLGIDDGKELCEPLAGLDKHGMPTASVERRELLSLHVLDESLAPIIEYESDRHSRRYQQPTRYNLTLSDPLYSTGGGSGLDTGTQEVHWSRVIHVVDNVMSSVVFGTPRLQSVLNNIYGLRKLYNSSPEMYWKGAFPGIFFTTHPQLGADAKINASELRTETEQMWNGLQRFMALNGMDVKALSPTVSDPTQQINAQIDAVCIRIGCPRRVFMGSERGELASTQDKVTWNGRLARRRSMHITPQIVVPFIDRLIAVGVLPKPQSYSVDWSLLNVLTQQEKTQIALQRTQAFGAYMVNQLENFIAPLDYLTRIHDFTAEEAQEIIDGQIAEQAAEDEQEQMVAQLSEQEMLAQLQEEEDGEAPTDAGESALHEVLNEDELLGTSK